MLKLIRVPDVAETLPTLPAETNHIFNFSKLELPNPAEWANNLGASLVDSMNARLHEIINEMAISFMDISLDVCIIAGLIGAILYVCGWKKCKSVPFISYGIYLIIQILGSVILGV